MINNTQDEYSGGHIIAKSVYIDDVNINTWWDGPFDIPPGKTVVFKHYIYPKDFEEAGKTEDFEKIEFQITMNNDDHTSSIEIDGVIEKEASTAYNSSPKYSVSTKES